MVVEAILDGAVDHVAHDKARFAEGSQLVEQVGVVFIEALGGDEQEAVVAGQVEPLHIGVFGPAAGAAAWQIHKRDAAMVDLERVVGGFHHAHLGDALASNGID
jgi:hypothetical protein